MTAPSIWVKDSIGWRTAQADRRRALVREIREHLFVVALVAVYVACVAFGWGAP